MTHQCTNEPYLAMVADMLKDRDEERLERHYQDAQWYATHHRQERIRHGIDARLDENRAMSPELAHKMDELELRRLELRRLARIKRQSGTKRRYP